MNTITDYLETMFINLAETPELMQLKVDLLANMEDKYEELKAAGKSEHEAIGTVIAEFGDIDEILAEMNLSQVESQDTMTLPLVDLAEAKDFITTSTRVGKEVGYGVVACCLGVAILLFLQGASRGLVSVEVLSLIPFFLFITIGVGLFITAGFRSKRLDFGKNNFLLTGATRQGIEALKKKFERSFTVSIVVGISIILMSLTPIFISVSLWPESEAAALRGTGAFLTFVSAGVFLIIYAGVKMNAYTILLKKGLSHPPTEYEIQQKRVTHILEEIYWPTIVIIYFLLSFFTGYWGFTWLLFLVGGVLEEVIKSFFGMSRRAR